MQRKSAHAHSMPLGCEPNAIDFAADGVRDPLYDSTMFAVNRATLALGS
jgi:hypothetical protein